MARFVLKYHGSNPRQADIDLIKRTAGVEVLDDELREAMLVDAPPRTARRLDQQLSDWTVAGEAGYPDPSPARESVRDEETG